MSLFGSVFSERTGTDLITVKKINKDLTHYLMSRGGKVVLRDDVFSPDLKMIAVAEESGPAETVKVEPSSQTALNHQADIVAQLLKMILLAAINSPEANNYLARMTELSVPAQAAIRSIIEEVCYPLRTKWLGVMLIQVRWLF